MSDKISTFTSAEAADRYRKQYDDLVSRYWPVPSTEFDLSGKFGTTRVRVSGSGSAPPLVLIHPTAGSSVGWYPLIEALSVDRRVFTPDTIGGPGRSVQTSAITSAQDLTSWLDEVLDALELTRVHLLGYSEGGWISASHAALSKRRDRVSTLTLLEPAGAIEAVPTRFLYSMIVRGARVLLARDKPSAIRDSNTWMNGDVELTEGQIDLLLAGMGSFRQRLPRPRRLSDEALRAISAPTRVLLGMDSKLHDPVRVRNRAQRLIPTVDVEIFPNAGHGFVFQYPDLVTDRILEHVGQEGRGTQ